MIKKSVHLYVHVPFCLKRCPFCRFTRSFVLNDMTNLHLIPDYIKSLFAEIQSIHSEEMNVLDIQFGGGTPTLLTGEQLFQIINMLKKHFHIEGAVPISLEILPDTLTDEKLVEYVATGVTRVSLGVQETDPIILKMLDRNYSKQDVFDIVEKLKKVDIQRINVDLISGLPGQTIEGWEETIKDILELKVDNVTLTNFMEYYKGFDLFIKRAKSFGYLPASTQLRGNLMKVAYHKLTDAGYINHLGHLYCKPDTRYDYEIDVFTVNDNIISFGPGVQTIYNNSLTIKANDIAGYLNNPFGIKKMVIDDLVEDYIRLNFFTGQGIVREEFEKRFSVSLEKGLQYNDFVSNLIKGLEERELFEKDNLGARIKTNHLMDGIVYLYQYFDEQKL